jgi:hypothetical protein
MARVKVEPSYRLVASRFPPVGLFDRVADSADLDVVFAIESLTNDRLRNEVGELHLVPPEERVSGPGTTPIMAAFTHLNPEGSRFSAGHFGLYYAAFDLETAKREIEHHLARFLARTSEPQAQHDYRCYEARIDAELVDIRAQRSRHPDLYDPDDYSASQTFGRGRRDEGAAGIAYDSVRNPGGQCVAIFKPRAIAPCVQTAHVCFVWDCARITGNYVKSAFASR